MADKTPPVTPPPAIPPKKSKPRDPIYVVIILLLLIGLGLMYYQMSEDQKKFEQCRADNIKLSEEANTLRSAASELGTNPEDFLDNLNNLLGDYDTMIAISSELENDNLDLMDSLEAKRAEIIALQEEVKMGRWSRWELTQKKEELEVLRGVLKTYVHRIDSLTVQNQALSARLGKVEDKLDEAVETIGQYEIKTSNQDKIISKGKKLKAANISANCFRLRNSGDEKATDRAKRADRVKTCFTVVENSIAKAGTKTVYLRVVDPSGQVMSSGASFKSADGSQVQYSDNREIDYQNADIATCIYYIFGKEVEAGTYQVELWAEGHLIGKSTFDLR